MEIPSFFPEARDVPGTATILPDDGKRSSADEYKYPATQFGERQENFYRNLLRLYRLTGVKELPIYFAGANGQKYRMDRGCIRMAEHDGFLATLTNNGEGWAEIVRLNW